MGILSNILAIVAAGFALIAAFFGIRKSQADANLARVKEHMSAVDAEQGRKIDEALAEIEAKQQAQKVESDRKLEEGKRDHLEGGW